jgi:hypothetical protein
MANIIEITNNSKKFKIDLKTEFDISNSIIYRIGSIDNYVENTDDNFINIKFFLNTDYVYNSTDSMLVVVSSYIYNQVVKYEEFIFKLEDMFFDKLINFNTQYVTIFFDNSGLSLTGSTYADLHGNITQIKIPIVSRIYGSSNVPIKTDIYGRIDISGQSVDISGQRVIADISGQRVDISGQRVDISGQRIDISGQRIDISGQRIDISGQRIDISGQRVDISGQRIDISGQRIDISGQRVLSNIYDWQNNGITSTNHTVFKYGLDTTSALATTDMTNRYLLTSTSDGGSKRGLDVNIASGTVSIDTTTSIPVSGTFFQETQPVSIDTSTPIPVTGDIIIDNGSTTNFNSATGINVYQILPKVKMYNFGGFDANATANGLIIGNATTGQVVSSASFNFGGTMQFWAVLGSAGTKNLTIDYVDASGDIVTSSIDINGTTVTSLGTFKSILDFRLSSTIVSGDQLFIGTANNVTTLKERSLYYEDINQKLVGAVTIPNGYIGYITNLTSQTNTASNITLNRWNSLGVKSAVWRVTNTGNIYINSGYDGTLGGIFNAGDTLAFSAQTAVAGKSVIANLVLKSIL